MSAPELPFVAVNMAMTLDGKVMRPDGGWHGLTSDEDREQMDCYRQAADVIFVGKNSIAADDPVVLPRRLRTADQASRATRTDGALLRPVPCMIVRSSLPPADRRLFTESSRRGVRPILFAGRDQPALSAGVRLPSAGTALVPEDLAPAAPEKLHALVRNAEVLPFARELLEPANVLDWLYRERGVRRVLLEGGPKMNHAFFAADLVDGVYLTLVPFLIGRNDLPGIVDGAAAFARFDQPRWRLDRSEARGGEIFLRYSRAR